MPTKNPSHIEKEIRDNLESDPSFTNTSKIILNVKNAGSLLKRRIVVELGGSVPDLRQKEKIERFIENKYGDRVELQSTLKVG